MKIYLYILIFISLLTFIDIINLKKNYKNIVYIFIVLGLALLVGLKEGVGTDTLNYVEAYNNIREITVNSSEVKNIYSDKGFILVTSLFKQIVNNIYIYFFMISLVTLGFLLLSLLNTTTYVILGILVYYIRFFFLRDLNQIRAALAISIIVYSIKFIKEKKKSHFLNLNIISALLHKSTIIFMITYKLANKKIKNVTLYKFFLITIIASLIIYRNIQTINIIFERVGIDKAYTVGKYGASSSLGYKNPIIYYHIFVFLIYLKLGKYTERRFEYYNIIKNIYFLSIIILLIFMPWSSIAGRLSTIFATVEIFMISSYLYAFKNKIIANLLIVFMLNLMAYYNIFIRLGQEYIYNF